MAEIELLKGTDRLPEAYPKVNRNFKRLNDQLEGHVSSATAHTAGSITYTGEVIGAENVGSALNALKNTMDELVVEGDSGPEAEAARFSSPLNKSFATLKDRLDSADAFSFLFPIYSTGRYASIQEAVNQISANGGGTLKLPAGVFALSSTLSIPAGVTLSGAGNGTILTASTPLSSLISCAGKIIDIKVNGNNQTQNGVSLDGDFCGLQRVYVQYCVNGIYNNGKDVHVLRDIYSDNCTHSFHSANRFINCVIDNYNSIGDEYALYFTYSDQQPQGIRIINSSFFGNKKAAIYFEKDAYEVIIENNMIDGQLKDCIILHRGTYPNSSCYKIKDNFICPGNSTPETGGHCLSIEAGVENVWIEGNTFTLAREYAIYLLGSASYRSSQIVIQNNKFNDNSQNGGGGGEIYNDGADQVDIIGNFFNTGVGTSYVALNTYAQEFTVNLDRNKFKRKPSVSVGNHRFSNNKGFVSQRKAASPVYAGQTSVTVTHGLDVTPMSVFLTPLGNLGNVWVSNITATTFTIRCSSAPTAEVYVYWNAEG